MTIDRYADAVDGLSPGHGEVETAELAVTDDVLVKAFALGPGATLDAHEHDDATNVFHVLEGEPTVIREDEGESLAAPAVVLNERGTVHGARNDTDERAVITASLCPLP
ncbi:cupin domain-containing protein [Halorubrum sp. CSM-61]|uniref:cupin domain-containing protein n=1 Tax=Halorubrum sp. CSM-61 TaxID=2485838 RepID=UPI000F4B409E|nr:cupin domain-containing protein [Halorubrum sp. CSM-61]